MSISDRDALLAAIIDNPEEDTPRLMFADWLKDNGESDRGEFVRLQVEAARAEPFSREARTAASAAGRLLGEHRGEWAKSVRQWVLAWDFGRGFVDHVAVNVVTFARDAATLFAAEPIRSLQPVRFATVAATPLDSFFRTPQLERVVRLDLSHLDVAPNELESLLECPHLNNLTDLCLRGRPVIPDLLRTLLLGPSMPALAGLNLADVTHLGPRLADTLPVLDRRFLRLDLSRVAFTSHQLKAVLESRCLREVEELRLAWMTGITREGPLRHLDLAWTLPWERLRLLDLGAQGLGDAGVDEVVRAARQLDEAPLRWLGLANNQVTSDGVRTLIRSNLKLNHLDLRGNGLSLSDLDRLQSRFEDAVIER